MKSRMLDIANDNIKYPHIYSNFILYFVTEFAVFATVDTTANLFIPKYMYSRLSLSRLRLSRTTAYLEEKIWSLFKHRNLKSGNKILWIRGEIAPQEQFLPFPTIFSIYISN